MISVFHANYAQTVNSCSAFAAGRLIVEFSLRFSSHNDFAEKLRVVRVVEAKFVRRSGLDPSGLD
jgi:hypothetical protein